MLTSTAYTLVRGLSALAAAAMPQASPPPPYGTRIASTSCIASRISRVIVPLPAITAVSAKGCTYSPSSPAKRPLVSVSHHSANGTLITVPPSRSTASVLALGAWSGTTTWHRTFRSRAHQATPCAMFPALAVHTPLASAAGSVRAIAFAAPRSLNEPIGWALSSLSQVSTPARPPSRRTSGVSTAIPAMRCRASWISASDGRARGGAGGMANLAAGRGRAPAARSCWCANGRATQICPMCIWPADPYRATEGCADLPTIRRGEAR